MWVNLDTLLGSLKLLIIYYHNHQDPREYLYKLSLMKEEGTKGDKNNDRCTVLVTKTSANNRSLVARFHVACFSYFLKSKSNHISEDIYL